MNSVNNHCGNRVNFTARMDVKDVTKNVERWKNIAKIFEGKTQKYDRDVFEIMDGITSDGGVHVYNWRWDAQKAGVAELNEHSCDFSQAATDKMLEHSDETIAIKFVKMLKHFTDFDKEAEKAETFVNKVVTKEDPTGFESKFWDVWYNKACTELKNKFAKDPILNEASGIN